MKMEIKAILLSEEMESLVRGSLCQKCVIRQTPGTGACGPVGKATVLLSPLLLAARLAAHKGKGWAGP